ncbi:uncharacterized protein DSM5745_11409 [Aspergillus mulundensis]|uniref:Uncharacterized protein n=1 Tax=Aspergillus mulundensis TaxID=1810919 RepID=A0A3D8Q7V6_9EURO|nr:hypothetical protein DSM5745_11409 [Aspergillus mulundensis]RDW57891.1 hypothetical protein DSM5745_11409 [Aspergillus mulundensis]
MDSSPVTCLGIGLPSCLRDLPVSTPTSADSEDVAASKGQRVREAICTLGEKSQTPQVEVEEACYLAAGLSDVVILLERPKPRHNYIQRCPSLKAVDELVKLATNGTRSINNTSVIDAFLLKPVPEQARPTDSECFTTVEQILTIKQPRVLICCWSGECQNDTLALLRSRGVGSVAMRSVARLNGNEMIVYHSFHPATAVCWNKCQPALRALLAYHFAAAFLELRHPQEPPEWALKLSKSAAGTNWNERLSLKAADASFRSLLVIILGDEKVDSVWPQTESTPSHVWSEIPSTLVRDLPTTSHQPGALAVAEATLLWREYFSDKPEFQQVLSELLKLGNRQNGFY